MSYSLREPETLEDHKWLISLHNDPLVLQNITNPTPITLESHLLWWNRIHDSTTEKRQIFEVNGERAGFAKFYAIDHANNSCVLGADLHADFRGKKLAEPMWKMMLQQCFVTWSLNRVSLTTAEYNAIGRHIYTKLGFKEEGRMIQSLYRDCKYWDQICMYMLRVDYWMHDETE
jgi:RimJ/RimL family protein N-acetyltransferase